MHPINAVTARILKGFNLLCSLKPISTISDEELRRSIEGNAHANFKQRHFFLAWENREEVVSLLCRMYPDVVDEILVEAQDVCNHVFELLGSGKTCLGERIDWHQDFKTGIRWPKKHYLRLKHVNLKDASEVKIPWELSRFHHAITLGQAYWLTGDEKYAAEFVSQLEHWILENPPGVGVNWKNTMEVAIRATNWMWGYYFFQNSPSFTESHTRLFLKSILAHGRHILKNLEYSKEVTTNHYLADLVGLVYLGLMFPLFKEAPHWLEKGVQGLCSEIEKQVYNDGVDFEASIGYHRFALELFLFPILLCQQNDIKVSASVMQRLEKMLEFTAFYTKPDGLCPLIGDSDDGRLHILDNKRNINDHRYLLAIGAILLERPDFKTVAKECGAEVPWLFGKEGYQIFCSIPTVILNPQSRGFPEGGIYVMRRDKLYLIVDCSSNGQKGRGGHAHNDTLSFELFAYDKTFIVDSGTYVYTSTPVWRNYFRSTPYHNTVVVDGAEMNRLPPKELFALRNDAVPRVNQWEVSSELDVLDAQHNGYERFSSPVTHRRQFYFFKEEGFWIIRDLLTGAGHHTFELYLHFSPIAIVRDGKDPFSIVTDCAGANLTVVALLTEGLSVERVNGWFSDSYGTKVVNPVVKFSRICSVPAEFLTVFFPTKAGKIDAREVRQLSERYLKRFLDTDLKEGGVKSNFRIC